MRRIAAVALMLFVALGVAACDEDPPLDERVVGVWAAKNPGMPMLKSELRFRENGTFRLDEEYRNQQGQLIQVQMQGTYIAPDGNKLQMTVEHSTQGDNVEIKTVDAGIRFNSDGSMAVSFTATDSSTVNQRVVVYEKKG